MKSIIVNFLIHVLSLLVPVEDHINAIVHKAKASKLAQEADAALTYAERQAGRIVDDALEAAHLLQVRARSEYAASVQASKVLTPVMTPEGAASLVAAASISAAPRGMPALSGSAA